MLRRRPAAAADDIHQPGRRPFLDEMGGLVRLLVVLAHGVGQAGVGICGDQGVGHPAQFGDERPHQIGPQRAVEADGERFRMSHAVPEGLRRLARQGAARAVGDGARNPDRQGLHALVLEVLDGLDRRLAVQRVGDGFDQIQVDPALVQRLHLMAIGVIDLVKGH